MRTPALLAVPLLFLPAAQPAQDRPAIAHYNVDPDGLALDGYDPVAYHPIGGGRAVPGEERRTVRHRGVTYRFASLETKERFEQTPARYEPAFGGWDAYAMAQGRQVDVDPRRFVVEDGRLLVFSAEGLEAWLAGDSKRLAARAAREWRDLAGETDPREAVAAFTDDGLALAGYDPVSYFEDEAPAPLEGREELEVSHQGLTFRFANEGNRRRFVAEPLEFWPALGGWSANRLADGERVEPNPRAYQVVDGELFLFASNADRVAFLRDLQGRRAAARRAWQDVLAGVWRDEVPPPRRGETR